MHLLHIEVSGLTASFRVPHMYKYHRSLPLPSYTTIVGIFGAAIGKDMQTSQELFKYFNLKVGVAGASMSRYNDTWRVLTTKNSERDVIERETLFKPKYHIIFYGEKKIIQLCEKSFKSPIYPISLGRPEDIANIAVHDIIEQEPEELEVLRNTVISGMPALQVEDTLFNIEDPTDPGPCIMLYRLPVNFKFKDGFSYERTADDYRDFTFIGNNEVKVENCVQGFRVVFENESNDKIDFFSKGSLNIPLLEI